MAGGLSTTEVMAESIRFEHIFFLEFKRESVSVMRDFLLNSQRSVSVMEISSSGSAVLYLQLEIHSSQKKCLSVINLDITVLGRKATRAMRAMRGNALETEPFQPYFGCTETFSKYYQLSISKQKEL